MHFFRKELLLSTFWAEVTPTDKILIIGGGDVVVNYEDIGRRCTDEEMFYTHFLQLGCEKCSRWVLFHEKDYQQEGEHCGNFQDIEQIYAENEFDRVIVLSGLEKESNPLISLAAIRRIVRRGGYIDLILRTVKNKYGHNFLEAYEDKWRYTEKDIANIFCKDAMVKYATDKDGLFLAAEIRKTADKDYRSEQDSLYACRPGKYIKIEDIIKYGYFSKYEELDDIGVAYNTDKSRYHHNYLDKYEFFLAKWKDEVFNLLELGIFFGSSAKMWEKYFTKAEIHCVDINPACAQFATDRIKPYIMDLGVQENLEALKKVNPTIIVDDASHFWDHQIMALFTLYDCLPSGGIYILEDMETSLNVDLYPGFSNGSPIDAYTICERITKVVASKKTEDMVDEFSASINNIGMATEMISIIKGSCVFIKR